MTEPYEPTPSYLGDDRLTRAYGISTNARRDCGIGLVQMGVEHLGVLGSRESSL
jgi:twinkle protein